jgi:hypothetical protein
VVVEQQPAQHLQPLLLIIATELAGAFREVGQNGATLRQAHTAMLQHRHLTQLIDFAAKGSFAGFTPKIIDEHRLPIATAQTEHQGNLVCIA